MYLALLSEELPMSLHPYPSAMNQEAVMLLVRAPFGELSIEVGHAAWDLVGFALSQVDPHDHPPTMAAAPMTEGEAKAVLQSLVNDGIAKADKVDWGKVLQALMFILGLFVKPVPTPA